MTWQTVALGVAVGMVAQSFLREAWRIVASSVIKVALKRSPRWQELVRKSETDDRRLRALLGVER